MVSRNRRISSISGTEFWVHPGSGRVSVLMVHQDGGVAADDGALRRAVKLAAKDYRPEATPLL
eukprot:SAG22_NODE_5943_length_927_cov_1.433575_1_plen_63_part_00